MYKNLKEEFTSFNYFNDDKWKTELPNFTLETSERIVKKPKVSVVIANYNNGPYLSKMLDSLIYQTIGLEKLQILFVDDKSTDNSSEIILDYLEKYSSIEYYQFDENTGGAHGPRNLGLQYIRGEYVVILDADDWYRLTALENLSNLMDDSQDNFAVGGIVQVNDKNVSAKSKAYYMDGLQKNREIQDLPYEFYEFLGPQGIMLRTKLVLENNLHFVSQRVADDVTFFYQALRLSRTISQLPEKTTYLNRASDNESLSKNINESFMISWLRALAFINETIPNDRSKELFLARRLDWLVLDFGLRRNIGYKFGLSRLKNFKKMVDDYLPNLRFNPSNYFRAEARKIAWSDLMKNRLLHLYLFVNWHSHRESLKIQKKIDNLYYFVFPFMPKILINVKSFVKQVVKDDETVTFEIEFFSNESLNGFEFHAIDDPFDVILPFEIFEKNGNYLVKFDRKDLIKNKTLHVITNKYHDTIVEQKAIERKL